MRAERRTDPASPAEVLTSVLDRAKLVVKLRKVGETECGTQSRKEVRAVARRKKTEQEAERKAEVPLKPVLPPIVFRPKTTEAERVRERLRKKFPPVRGKSEKELQATLRIVREKQKEFRKDSVEWQEWERFAERIHKRISALQRKKWLVEVPAPGSMKPVPPRPLLISQLDEETPIPSEALYEPERIAFRNIEREERRKVAKRIEEWIRKHPGVPLELRFKQTGSGTWALFWKEVVITEILEVDDLLPHLRLPTEFAVLHSLKKGLQEKLQEAQIQAKVREELRKRGLL